MEAALRPFFEEQVRFRLQDGTEIEGGVFVGGTRFLPLEILRDYAGAYRQEFDLWLNEIWKPEMQQRREEILRLHANKKRYADLIEAVGRQQVVPFIGSGMSVASGLPTWSDLLRKIRDFTQCDEEKFERLLQSCQYEEAADLVAAATNPRLLAERVEHDLRIDEPSLIGGAVRLLPAVFQSLVITTNLDDVLEHVYLSCSLPFNYVMSGVELVGYRSFRSANSRFLLKLHGDCRRVGGRVLLSGEYESTYAGNSSAREELALLYRSHNLLFLGCSLGSDRTVRLVEEVAGSDVGMPKHYCFLALPIDDATRIARENFLTHRGIYPIWYSLPHDESLIALLDGLLAAAHGGIR